LEEDFLGSKTSITYVTLAPMWLSNALLKKFQTIKELGLDLPRAAGTQVGRGFADLGFEQFLLTSETAMVSLFNGATSQLPPGHEKFFFWIPSIDELTQRIIESSWTIDSLAHLDGRKWVLKLRSEKGVVVESIHRDLYELFVDAYLGIMKK
jgi:hypothetical protein